MSSALRLLEKAETLLKRGRPRAALPLLRAARRAGTDRFLRAEAAWQEAETLRSLGRFRRALAAYWLSHRLYRLSGVSSERLRTLLGASACLRVMGRFREARAMWASASRQAFFKAPEPSPEEVSLEIALVERGLGLFRPAGQRLKRVLGGRNERVSPEILRHAWWALAGVERFSGRFVPALKAFRRAETLARRLKDDPSRAYALCGQAACLRILGQGRLSFLKYREAHGIFRRAGDLFGQAYGLCGMGNALRVWGDARGTLPLYRRSAALYEKVGDLGSMAFAFWGLGGSLRRLGDFRRAWVFYRKALALFRRVDDPRGVVMTLLGLARVDREAGRRAAAAASLGRAFQAARKADLPYERALCRWEASRLSGGPAPAGLFAAFGVTDRAARGWRDLP